MGEIYITPTPPHHHSVPGFTENSRVVGVGAERELHLLIFTLFQSLCYNAMWLLTLSHTPREMITLYILPFIKLEVQNVYWSHVQQCLQTVVSKSLWE